MSPQNDVLNLISSFAPYLPVMIVMAVGVILAIARWKRHPKISLLALLGLGGQMILFVISMALNFYAGRFLFSTWTSEQITTFYTMKYIVTSLIEAGLWVLIVMAIFSMRDEQSRPAAPNYGRPAAPTSA